MSKQKGSNTICLGCLSTNRSLTSIENYYHIYQNIIGESTKIWNDSDQPIPQMCWECNAILRNIEKFRLKVLEANIYLAEKNKKCQKKTLSNLVVSTDQKIIDIIYTDEKELVNDIKIDVEVLKEEPIDYKPLIDPDFEDYKEIVIYDDVFFDNKDSIIEDIKEESVGENIEHLDNLDTYKEESEASVTKKKRKGSKKYKVIYMNEGVNSRMYDRRRIDDKEREYWLEQEKKGRHYRLMAFKCELCISGFAKEKYYIRHLKTFHSETSGGYTCDICKIHLRAKSKLYLHIKEHYTKYVCNMCTYQSYNDHQMRTHMYCAHKRAVKCLKCGMTFVQFPHFHDHYKKLHLKVICDYCGQSFTKKKRLIKHIRLRHNEHRCTECNKTYLSFHALVRHTNLHHVKSAKELCYCVECNIQFDNVTLYTRHLKRSVKHRVNTGIPCPECNKVYHRRHVMLNHYNYVHLKKTKHYCELCNRYFLNGFRIRQHIASTHDKVPRVKNKMCPYCNRGFSTNRILENHIRTHTGERPFACDECTATFAQRQGLVSHTRAIHKILDFK